MKRSSYKPEEIAKILANGHCSYKHFRGQSKSSIEIQIIETLLDKDTKVFRTHDKKDYYLSEKYNRFISVDLKNKHGGTYFTFKNGDKGKKYYQGQIDLEKNKRVVINGQKLSQTRINKSKLIPDLKIEKGGYPSLYKTKKIDKSLRFKLDREAERKRIEKEYQNKLLKNAKSFDALMEKKKKLSERQEKREALTKKFNENKKQIEDKENLLFKLAKKEKEISEKKELQKKESINKQNLLAKLAQKEKEIQAEIERKKLARQKEIEIERKKIAKQKEEELIRQQALRK